MIEKIPDLPNNILGFTAKGTITANDYESVIIPAVEELFSIEGKVRFLYQLGKDFKGFEAAAIVSDIEWIRAAIKIFGLVIPGHVRVFHNNELAEAIRWISE